MMVMQNVFGRGNKVHDGLCKNGEYSSFKNPHFQNEAKCKAILAKMSFTGEYKIIFTPMALHLASL